MDRLQGAGSDLNSIVDLDRMAVTKGERLEQRCRLVFTAGKLGTAA